MLQNIASLRVGSAAVVVLGALVVAGTAPTTAALADPATAGTMPADLAAASAAAQSSGQPVPVDDLTTETTQIVAQPDGTFISKSSLQPVRAKIDGDWQGVDTTLEPSGGRLQPEVTSTPVTFSAGGNATLATVSTSGGSMTLTWPTDLPVPTVDGDTATYPNVLPGVDLAMTATPDGYSQVMIVHNADAAANPALQRLQIGTTTDGLTLHPNADNTVSIVDDSGKPVLQNAAPIMWDSGTDPHIGGAATADDPGSGEVTPLNVAVTSASTTPDGQTASVAVSPPASALAGPGVDYPVFIDPPLQASYGRQHWAEVLSNGWHYYDDSAWNPKIGYCGWSDCNGIGTGRAYMQYDLANLNGMGDIWIANATLYLENIHSAVCDNNEPTLLYSAGTVNAQTPWPGPLGTQLASNPYTYGDTCSGGAQELVFNGNGYIEQYLQDSYNGGNSSVTFGIRAQDESDRNQWKQFSNAGPNATTNVNVLEFSFTYRPQAPTNLSITGSVNCNGDGIVYTGDATPRFSALVRDGYRDTDSVPQNVTFKTSRYNGLNASMPSGRTLTAGQAIETTGGNGGAVKLAMQTDGNFVLYARGTAVWATYTSAADHNNRAVMQGDGNLVVYTSAGRAVWSSGTAGHSGSYASIQSDGNLVVRASNATPLWTTATHTPLTTYASNASAVVVASNSVAPWTETTALTRGSWVVGVTDTTNPNTTLEWTSQKASYAFTYLPTPTVVPTITSLDYPQNSWGPATGSFHVDAGDVDDVAGFAYSWAGASDVPLASSCSFAQPQDVTPSNGIVAAPSGAVDISIPSSGWSPGVHTLAIRSVDRAHNESPAATYVFYTAPAYTNVGTGKYEAEDLAAAGAVTSSQAGNNQMAEFDCDACSQGQAERLGSSIDATFTVTTTPPVEADYAVGLWIVGGTNRGALTAAMTTATGALQRFGRPDASADGGFAALTYDTSTASTTTPTFVPLGGTHLGHIPTSLNVNVSGGSIVVDSLSLIPIANVTTDSFAGALNNRGIYVSGGAAADIGNTTGGRAFSRTAMSPAYAAGATVKVNNLTFTMPTPDASAPGAQRYDNLVMDGQTIRLHGIKTSSINLLVTSVCGNAPSTPATRFIVKYGTATQPDPNGDQDLPVTPAVPDWISGAYSGPVTSQDGGVTLTAAATFNPYAMGTGTVATNSKIYTLRVPVDPTKSVYSVTMPYYGNGFNCAVPVVHALAMSTS